MPKYRKKTYDIEARQFTGDNAEEIAEWSGARVGSIGGRPVLFFDTVDGIAKASRGFWIIRRHQGVFDFCSPSYFEMTYEAVE